MAKPVTDSASPGLGPWRAQLFRLLTCERFAYIGLHQVGDCRRPAAQAEVFNPKKKSDLNLDARQPTFLFSGNRL